MSGKTGMIIIGILIVVILVVGVGGFLYFKSNSGETKEPEKFTISTEDMYSNIKESSRIVKIKITVETLDEKSVPEIQEKSYLVRDISNKIIRAKSEEELLSVDGQLQLQEEIKEKLVELMPNELISNVYFDDFVIQ